MSSLQDCLRKKPFLSDTTAYKEAKKVSRERGVALYVYKCPHCQYYHMTSNPYGKEVIC